MANLLGAGIRRINKGYAMKRPFAVGFLVVAVSLSTISILAADTANVLGEGVCINEILIDPSGSTASTDTDGNGTVSDADEFVELYNLSASNIDISGWQLWDAVAGMWYQFPGSVDDNTTVLRASAYVVVVAGVQAGGSLPLMTNPESLAYDAGRGTEVLTNGGDNVVVYDPGDNQYIQLNYRGDTDDYPPTDYAGFTATATRSGSIENFGYDVDGKSLTRFPSGDSSVVVHDAIAGIDTTSSPNKLTINHIDGRGITPLLVGVIATTLITGLALLNKRS